MKIGSGLGSVEAWYTSALDIEEVLAGATDSDIHLFVADVIKSFDTVDRRILDRVLRSLGLPRWLRDAYFEYHAHVRLRFKLATGLGELWTRDGRILQGCPLSMMFIVALYLPWCRYLAAHEGVQPQLHADNLKCVSRDPDLLLNAARFTTGYVSWSVRSLLPVSVSLLITSRVVRKDMKDWVLSQEGDRWSVKFDVRDFGGHLDTTFRGWSSTLAARVRLVISRLVQIFALPLDFHGRVRVVRSIYLPAALHGIEASFVRITVFCSAIVIDVIVHCHTAGALLSQTAENNCPYHRVVGFLILSGQFIITLAAELGIQPLIRSFWTETSAITFSTFSIAVTVFPSSTYGGDLSLSVDGACIIAFSAQCTGRVATGNDCFRWRCRLVSRVAISSSDQEVVMHG